MSFLYDNGSEDDDYDDLVNNTNSNDNVIIPDDDVDEVDTQLISDAISKVVKYINETYLSLYKRKDKTKEKEVLFFFNIIDSDFPASHQSAFSNGDYLSSIFINKIQDTIEDFVGQTLIECIFYEELDSLPEYLIEVGVITQNKSYVVDSEILFSSKFTVDKDGVSIEDDMISCGGALVTDEIYYFAGYSGEEAIQEAIELPFSDSDANSKSETKSEVKVTTLLPATVNTPVNTTTTTTTTTTTVNNSVTTPKVEDGVVAVKVNLEEYLV